ncbi:PREDICTED: putative nuclease HARBI1 isoform X2 [Papilio polytes]|uniref:putative nuclease HARBI1 isoform X2 n=1 Tax=Papilio polytes TaxID=76194 RepID=UPI0006760E3B|nr:PREDICTED: putative nuclease HARBI1 isoform X2 [Papilio polytes]
MCLPRIVKIVTCRPTRDLMKENSEPLPDLSDDEFMQIFHLKRNIVKELIEELRPLIPNPRRSDGVPLTAKILITLAFYASGSIQTLVSKSPVHNVSQATVSRAVKQVTEAFDQIYHKYVKWPTQRSERLLIKAKFCNKFKIPGVLGCIDGTHVAILKPSYNSQLYNNVKGSQSINVMIVCDSDLNILCTNSSSPGSTHDSIVWENNILCKELNQLHDEGDCAYPLRRTMMTPILNTREGTPEHAYYLLHAAAHSTIERCISDLKSRFRCLLLARSLHYSPAVASKIVKACCILHNIANEANSPVPEMTLEEIRTEKLRTPQDVCLNELEMALEGNGSPSRALLEGEEFRQALINRLWMEP